MDPQDVTETQTAVRRARTLLSDGQPDRADEATGNDDSYFRRFGEQFIDDTRAYRGSAPFFIDKMPNNFFHIGLIGLVLPNAKVIVVLLLMMYGLVKSLVQDSSAVHAQERSG